MVIIGNSLPACVARVLILVGVCAPCALGGPVVNTLLPRGGERGTTVTLDLTGTALDLPLGLLFHSPGMQVQEIAQVSPTHAKCTVKIDAACAIGLQAVRLRTASGLSNIKLFSVGSLPESVETEPNNSRQGAQVVSLPTTINGVILPEDVDLFAFDAAAGQTLAFEIEALRLGDALFDPVLTLYDTQGRVMALADDVPLLRQDAAIVHTFASAGRYTLEVRETAYGGGGDFRYRLHAGAIPRPIAVFPSGGTVGTAVDVRWIGDPTLASGRITMPAVVVPDYRVSPAGRVADAGNGLRRLESPSGIPFRQTAHAVAVEAEPNNDDDHATTMAAPGAASGIIAQAADVDCFVFDGVKGQTFDANVFARRIGSALDPVLGLRKHKGAALAGNDDAVGPDSQLRFTIPDDGKYILEVRDMLARGHEAYSYFLELTPVMPALTLTMQPEGGAIVVPVGGRAAALVTANRRDFAGAVSLRAEGLPRNVRMLADVMPAGVNQLPVVFEADAAPATQVATQSASQPTSQPAGESASQPADAKCGALVELVAASVDAGTAAARPIEGRLRQSIDLVKFENNPFYQWTVSQLALAVCDAAPFRLIVAAPRVPIVQRGQMDLPVRVEREAGYAGEVSVRLLWNPPGVSSGGATLKADQSAGVLPITAAESAGVAKWTLVAVATGPMATGPVEVAALPFVLEVAAPFVDFAIARSRTDVGKPVDVMVKVTQRTAFDGDGRAELLGLPPKVAASQAVFTRETAELKFPLTVDAAAPPGQYGSLAIRAVVMRDGQAVPHQSPGGLLIVDQPLPPPDPKIEAERAEARKRAEAEKAKKKADRAAAAEERRQARENQRKSASTQPASQPAASGASRQPP